MFKLTNEFKLSTINESSMKAYHIAMKSCEEDVENNINECGMESLTQAWFEAKKGFIELFNGKQSIEIDVEEPLTKDAIVSEYLRPFIDNLMTGDFTVKREYYKLQVLDVRQINMGLVQGLWDFMNTSEGIKAITENKLEESTLDNYYSGKLINRMGVESKRVIGIKFTKFLIMYLKSFINTLEEKGDEFDKELALFEIDVISQEFSKVVNSIKTSKRTQTVVLSCALEDFMSMSYGNGWESCHRLGGLYGHGCIAYALSENVLIAYTKNAHKKHVKNWRQVIYCDHNTGYAIGSRQYPFENINATTAARNLWQSAFNIAKYGVNNTDGFTFSKSSSDLSQYLKANNDFAYIDIISLGSMDSRINGKVWSTWHNDHGKNELIVCPSEIVCPDCGGYHSERYDYQVACPDCSGHGTYCQCCGDRHNESDMTYVDCVNDYVCQSCLDDDFCYCEECGEYHSQSDCTYVESVSGYVCQSCLDDDFTYCEDCQEYHRNHYTTSINDGNYYVCDDCLSSGGYICCEDCGDYYSDDKVTSVDKGEKFICECCIDNYTYCDECGEYFTDIISSEHGEHCEECYNDLDLELEEE